MVTSASPRGQGVQQGQPGAVAEQGEQLGGEGELLLAGGARMRIDAQVTGACVRSYAHNGGVGAAESTCGAPEGDRT